MSTIVTRTGKGSALTTLEMDANFTNLNIDKAELSGATFTGNITATAIIPSGSTVPANGVYLPAANTLAWSTNTTHRVRILSNGNVLIGTTTDAGNLLHVEGNISFKPGSTAYDVGYRDIPQNTQNGNYTFALTDRGSHVYHTSATAHNYTIPTNATVAFPIGTAITIVNDSGAGNITIVTTSIALRWAGNSSTGNRTIAANGLATLLKIGTDTWFINGAGIT